MTEKQKKYFVNYYMKEYIEKYIYLSGKFKDNTLVKLYDNPKFVRNEPATFVAYPTNIIIFRNNV